jgi:hypothetical protein
MVILGGIVTVPPGGTVSPLSTVTVVFSGVSSSGISAGPINMQSFFIAGTINSSPLGLVNVTGNFQGTQAVGPSGTGGTWTPGGVAGGVLTPGLAQATLTQALYVYLNAYANCAGALCALVNGGNWPVSISSVQTIAGLPPMPLANLNSVGNAALSAPGLVISLNGIPATINLVGTEVTRTFVPEPGSGLLVASALVGLAALVRLRRRK